MTSLKFSKPHKFHVAVILVGKESQTAIFNSPYALRRKV